MVLKVIFTLRHRGHPPSLHTYINNQPHIPISTSHSNLNPTPSPPLLHHQYITHHKYLHALNIAQLYTIILALQPNRLIKNYLPPIITPINNIHIPNQNTIPLHKNLTVIYPEYSMNQLHCNPCTPSKLKQSSILHNQLQNKSLLVMSTINYCHL